MAGGGTFTFYNTFREYLGDGTIDADTDTFKWILVGSGYTPDAESHTVYADVSGQELTGNGYSAQTASAVSWTRSTTTVTFDCADITWTASGGTLSPYYAILYDDTPTSPADPLVGYIDLNTTAQGESIADGSSLKVQVHANGVFTQG